MLAITIALMFTNLSIIELKNKFTNMRGKKGTITQTGMYVKIDNELLNKLKNVPTWNMNKNLTINLTLRIGLNVMEEALNKQLKLEP